MRRPLILVAFLSFLGVAATASTQSSDIVTVVVATDASGRPVRDLIAEEFRVFEDAAPQQHRLERVSGRERGVIILIDDLHLQPADSILTRRALEIIRDTVLTDGHRVAIVSTGTSSVAQDLVRDPDHRRVNATIARIMGAADALPPPDRRDYHLSVTLRTAAEILRTLAPRPDMTAVMFLVSNGYEVNPFINPTGVSAPDFITQFADVFATARRNLVPIHALDPRGISRDRALAEQQHLPLRVLAERTGGLCLCDTNDFRAGLERIDAGLSDYYVVKYTPANQERPKMLRQLRIDVTRPGITLRYAPNVVR